MRRRRILMPLILALLLIVSQFPVHAAESGPGSIRIVIDGSQRSLKQPAMESEGTIMLPLREVVEALGADLSWEAATNTVVVHYDTTVIRLTVGSATATRNGSPLTIAPAPMVANGTLMVPLAFVGEALGIGVGWNPVSKTAYIWSPSHLTGAPGPHLKEGQFALGDKFAVAVAEDGSVWAWGETGDAARLGQPVQVKGLTDIVAVDTSWELGVALKADGTVWEWKYTPNYPDLAIPRQVEGITDVVSVQAGGNYRMALRRDGTLWAWGTAINGEFGDGEIVTRSKPAPVESMTQVVAFAAGHGHVLAVKKDGSLWAWGSNEHGQLGVGTTSPRSTPVKVEISGVKHVAAGPNVSFAIKQDGSLWGWGDNRYTRRIDDIQVDEITQPVPVQQAHGGFRKVRAVGAGFSHTVVLLEDGTAWTWGGNSYGVLGHPDLPGDGFQPRPLLPGLPVAALTTAWFNTLLLTEQGELWGTGDNRVGQLGDGTLRTPSDYALAIVPLRNAPDSPVIMATLPAKGRPLGPRETAEAIFDRPVQPGPAFGQITLRNGEGAAVPVKVTINGTRLQVRPARPLDLSARYTLEIPAGAVIDQSQRPLQAGKRIAFTTADRDTAVSAVGAGADHTLVVRDGQVWAWGLNFARQLAFPEYTATAAPRMAAALPGVVAVAGTREGSLALLADGTLWAWGRAHQGPGYDYAATVPARKRGLPALRAVAGGADHVLALDRSGLVWAWGSNANRQLGVDDVTWVVEPVIVPGLERVTAVAAGPTLSAALREDGSVWFWGGEERRVEPAPVPGLTDVAAIQVGARSIYALKRDGSVWRYENRQLQRVEGLENIAAISINRGDTERLAAVRADGTLWTWTATTRKLEQVAGPTDIVAVAAGGDHFVALSADGTLWTWGDNRNGQLGNGILGGTFPAAPIVLPDPDQTGAR